MLFLFCLVYWRIFIDSLFFCSVFVVIFVYDVGKFVCGLEGEVYILDNIGMIVYEGESVVIVGVLGFGKIILFGLFVGLDLFSCGSIILVGELLDMLDEEVCV